MFGSRPMSSWIQQYASSHQHPLNRLLHTIGIPAIVVAILLAPASVAWPSLRLPAAMLFIGGWVLQFIGHAVEGKRPEFFTDWRFLFVGVRWWIAKVRGEA
ncbi:MAG: DUF962 domain-containing protein [Vicinamibacterales bacterium]